MDDGERGRRSLRFGNYEIDRDARELRRSGRRVPLQIQPFAILEILAERSGEVVTREHLRSKIWPSTVYVDFDHGLNNAITRLRRALGDSAESPRYLETLPRVGYRFLCPVEKDEAPAPAPSQVPIRRHDTMRLATAAAIAIGVVLLSFGAMRWAGQPAKDRGARAEMTANQEARDAYRRGVELFEQRRKESLERSIEYLRRATESDPSFAAAFAALASAYALAGGNSLMHYRSQAEVVGPALAAAQRALQLDPSLPDAHVAVGLVLNHLVAWSADNDVVIENAYLRALELDAASANAHLFYGNFLSTRGRNDEAVEHFRRAVESAPLSPSANSRLGQELVANGQVEQGIEYLRKTVELDPWQFNAQVRLGWGYLALANLDAAENAFQAADRISPDSVQSKEGLAVVAARRGDAATARAILQTLLSLPGASDRPFEIAMIYVALRDADLSIEWLKKTAQKSRTLHSGQWAIQSPIYDWLRGDPRFDEIEREITAAVKPSTTTKNGRSSRSIRG
jgi:DNA-binding winged helix-turn-helix (wHTH) protein/Tfp pilus assembly protein PilF